MASNPKASSSDPGDPVQGGGVAGHVNRTLMLLGPSGSGKTVLALQHLMACVEAGQRGIFLSFDEPPARIRATAAGFGWDVRSLESERRLLLHARVRPHLARAGQFAIEAVLGALGSEIKSHEVKHVVFDGLHVMLALLETRQARLQAALRLRDWVHENEVAAVFTYCVGLPNQMQAFGPELLETVADCVVALEISSGAEQERHLRFVRYRCAPLPAVRYPIRISRSGVEVLAPEPKDAGGCSPEEELLEVRKAGRSMSRELRLLHRFLEAKQAEFDLFLETRSAQAVPPSVPQAEDMRAQ